MTPVEQFQTMALVRSSITEDSEGNLIKVETRKCARTGLVLTASFAIAPSVEYISARTLAPL